MMKPLSILVLLVLLLIACGEKSEAISITDTYRTVSTPSLDLLTAIDKKNLNIIKQHIAAGTNINDYAVPQGQPWEGAQPMHIAVLKNNAEIIKILLENGANINIKAKNKEQATPLHWAVFFQLEEMVSLLIKSGANINAKEANGLTPVDTGILVKLSVLKKPKELEKITTILMILSKNGGLSADEL